MKIHDVTPLLTQGLQGASRVAKADATESSPATPAAIYHGSEPYSAPSTGFPSDIEVYARALATEQEQRQYMEVFTMMNWDLGNVSGDLRQAYEAALGELPPELAAKDWSFSIANDQLVVSEGSDRLSEQEIASIRDAFGNRGVDLAARTVADLTITALEYDRNWGDDNVTGGIGRYDLNRENFADIVDLRAYLDSHGPDGPFGQNVREPTDYQRLYRITGAIAMMDQIATRAVARFAK